MSKSSTKTTRKTSQLPPLESDSLSSFFMSWQKNRAPPIYPNAQTGHVVTATEFVLFFVAVILLVLAVGLSGVSSWSLFFRPPYVLLVTNTLELAYFAFPVAVLCLPCFWITLSIHNDEKSRKFLPLVLLLLAFSIVLMIIGVYVGLLESRKDAAKRAVWDRLQTTSGCCSDWFAVTASEEVVCRDNSTSSVACLELIAGALALRTCLFNGINCVALSVQCCAFVVLTVVYFCGKRGYA